jgi:phosphate starvation-inducible protein PhoH
LGYSIYNSLGISLFYFNEVIITQIEKKIKLENVDLQSLIGFNDANLAPLEERLSASISIRGDIATVKGVAEEVDYR